MDQARYEMRVGDHIALIQYRNEKDGTVSLLHTEVPSALEGQGIESKLVKGVLDYIRFDGQRVVPHCTFIAAYLDQHPESRDLLAAGAGAF